MRTPETRRVAGWKPKWTSDRPRSLVSEIWRHSFEQVWRFGIRRRRHLSMIETFSMFLEMRCLSCPSSLLFKDARPESRVWNSDGQGT